MACETVSEVNACMMNYCAKYDDKNIPTMKPWKRGTRIMSTGWNVEWIVGM